MKPFPLGLPGDDQAEVPGSLGVLPRVVMAPRQVGLGIIEGRLKLEGALEGGNRARVVAGLVPVQAILIDLLRPIVLLNLRRELR